MAMAYEAVWEAPAGLPRDNIQTEFALIRYTFEICSSLVRDIMLNLEPMSYFDHTY